MISLAYIALAKSHNWDQKKIEEHYTKVIVAEIALNIIFSVIAILSFGLGILPIGLGIAVAALGITEWALFSFFQQVVAPEFNLLKN